MKTNGEKVTLKDISEVTGYSLATVCNVINRKKKVNPETAQKIIDAANELGYGTTRKIRKIILVMYRINGQILMETPLILSLIDGIEKEGQKHHVGTIIYNIDKRELDYQKKLDHLMEEKDCGIILLATEMSKEDLKPFYHLMVPFVVVDAWFYGSGFPTVLMSNSETMQQSVDYLFRMGHRKIGYIDSSIKAQNFIERNEGYCKGMSVKNLPIEEKYQISLFPTMEGAQATMKTYLDAKPELPTAFVVVNDIIALGAMKALEDKGYRVPEDISIIGFDNMPFGKISSPELTTFNVMKEEIGQYAAWMLFKQVEGEKTPIKIIVQNELVERGSVKNLNQY